MFNTLHHRTLMQNNEVHLWQIFTDQLPVTLDENLLRLLSPPEQNHYHKLRLPKVKREYLVTRALVRRALSHYTDVAPLEWEFVKNEHGCPRLAPSFSDLNLNFNLTHSHGAVACLIAHGHQVGVDIESFDRKNNFSDIAKSVLTPWERTSLSNSAGTINFLHYWTLKEAYSKALGLGLSIHFQDIVCVFDGIEPEGFTALPKQNWQFLQTPIHNNHLLAVAIGKATPDDVAVRIMNCDDELDNVRSGALIANALKHAPQIAILR